MNIRIKNVLLGLMVFCSFSALAESRNWTLVDGRVFEADFIATIGLNYVLKARGEKQITVPISAFSDEDRLFVELSKPPRLEIDFIRNLNTVVFSEGYYGSYPREPEQHGNFGFRVKQMSAGRYKHELSAEVFVVAKQIGVPDRKCFILDRQKVEFRLTEKSKRQFQFMSTRQVRLQNWHFEYGDSKAVDRGEIYYGYLIEIKDMRGETIALQASKEWLKGGVENLKKLNVGNFFDKKCIRCFPGRPVPLRW